MAKYLLRANYTIDGTEGLLKEGGTARRQAVAELTKSLGGSLDAFYYAFGDADAYVIVDLPSQEAAAAAALVVGAGRGAHVSTTVLMTCEQIDEAAKLSPQYRPPGG
jgi:uncharacterized protein with GYD domain